MGKQAEVAPWQSIPHRSALADLPQLADEVGAEGVILVGSAVTAAESAAAVHGSLACGLHVQFWPGLAGVLSSRIRTAPVSGLPMLYVEAHTPPAWHYAVKRAIDIMTAAVLLPLSVPVLLLAAIGIRLEDRGPVFYRHAVIGRYGVHTEVLKLRTMVPNAAQMQDEIKDMNEREGGPLFKATNDPRVTRIGRLLRDTSIDELPQLWDVLTGRMSLVGPRFAMPKEAALFDEELRRRRTIMRPGITGLWQTEARDNPSFSAYRRLDLLYVDNWSLGLDLAIHREHGSRRDRPGGAGRAPATTVIASRGSLPRRPSLRSPKHRGQIVAESKDERERFRSHPDHRPEPAGAVRPAGLAGVPHPDPSRLPGGGGLPQGPGRPLLPGHRRSRDLQVPAVQPRGRRRYLLRSSMPTPSPPPWSCRSRPSAAVASARSRAATLLTSSGPSASCSGSGMALGSCSTTMTSARRRSSRASPEAPRCCTEASASSSAARPGSPIT